MTSSFKETLNKLPHAQIVASRARSLLAYLCDMSRRSLCGSLHSGLLATLVQRFLNVNIAIAAPQHFLLWGRCAR